LRVLTGTPMGSSVRNPFVYHALRKNLFSTEVLLKKNSNAPPVLAPAIAIAVSAVANKMLR